MCPDQVLIIFGILYQEYTAIKAEDTSSDTPHMINRILSSIKKQWAKLEQEALIAAVILNPVYKLTPFSALDFTTSVGCLALIKKLYLCFFQSLTPDEDQGLYDKLDEYLHDCGCYKNFTAFVINACQHARGKV